MATGTMFEAPTLPIAVAPHGSGITQEDLDRAVAKLAEKKVRDAQAEILNTVSLLEDAARRRDPAHLADVIDGHLQALQALRTTLRTRLEVQARLTTKEAAPEAAGVQ